MPMQGLLLDTTALAAIALIGYICGKRSRSVNQARLESEAEEASQAQRVVIEIQRTADRMRRELACHQGGVAAFCRRLEELDDPRPNSPAEELAQQAQALLERTQGLATHMTGAYDELRQQTATLMSLSGSRLDESTGAYNRQTMHEHLEAMLLLDPGQSERHFCVATFSVAAQDDDPEVDAIPAARLARVARVLEACARDTDFVARYSDDEFAVLMPQTELPGALVFCDRVLRRVVADLAQPIWIGVAQALVDESAASLLSRTDTALYTARTQPSACLFQHDGAMIRRHVPAARTSTLTAADAETLPLPTPAPTTV